MRQANYSYHYMVLKLKNPSEEAKGTPLSAFKEQVLEATEEFNKTFKGIKSLIFLGVTEGTIDVLLVFFHPIASKVTAKELTVFSRYLYHDKGWGRFSKEEGKLFILAQPVKEFDYTDADYALSEYEVDRDRYPFFPDYGPDLEDDEAVNEQDDSEAEDSEELADEAMAPILQYILTTQNMGPLRVREEKQRAIRQIKKILSKIVYL
ncbi:hypothetical protein COLU111180_18560 [Cohnella lubricantis]|uniref:Uncharacterized protein n=1 Tax=Cohnella lubricantis TaxID=2163172 RepID=A0A841TBJ4_9BACL|nr:hypothetical protein [Cohnella lubricantis]MBB6675801.1 hypothetical protein [Cohnella lubricantis]MBP2119880.1 hypothetical protein [Cohnella lubricantis]